MTTQIAVKLSESLLSRMDQLVGSGDFPSRSAIVRRGLEILFAEDHRRRIDEGYQRGYARAPETARELADAYRLGLEAIEDEPWEKWW